MFQTTNQLIFSEHLGTRHHQLTCHHRHYHRLRPCSASQGEAWMPYHCSNICKVCTVCTLLRFSLTNQLCIECDAVWQSPRAPPLEHRWCCLAKKDLQCSACGRFEAIFTDSLTHCYRDSIIMETKSFWHWVQPWSQTVSEYQNVPNKNQDVLADQLSLVRTTRQTLDVLHEILWVCCVACGMPRIPMLSGSGYKSRTITWPTWSHMNHIVQVGSTWFKLDQNVPWSTFWQTSTFSAFGAKYTPLEEYLQHETVWSETRVARCRPAQTAIPIKHDKTI